MLTSWANHAVVAALGFAIGMIVRVVDLVTAPEWEKAGARRPGEGFWAWMSRRPRDEQTAMTQAMRRASFAFMASILLLVLVVWLSPVELGWWTLLISALLGGLSVEGVYRLARAHKLPTALGSRFDPLPTRLPPEKTAASQEPT
jgi:hypothetical protein